jgi:hypothetical protein
MKSSYKFNKMRKRQNYIYIGLSLAWSYFTLHYSNLLEPNYPIFSFFYFWITTFAGFAFKFTKICPFKIFSRWMYNTHLPILPFFKRSYRDKWTLAIWIYSVAIITFIIGLILLP